MGQTSSRMLRKIILYLPDLDVSYKFLPKVLQALSSRARHGDFETLVLHIPQSTAVQLRLARDLYMRGSDGDMATRWEDMMMTYGETGVKSCRYKREVVFPKFVEAPAVDGVAQVATDIHNALGGKLFLGDVLVGENRVMIGESVLERLKSYTDEYRRQYLLRLQAQMVHDSG